jgi:hypothetical protein
MPGLTGEVLIFQWKGMVEYIPCYTVLGTLTQREERSREEMLREY